MKRLLASLVIASLAVITLSAQITIPYTFTTGTTISSSQVNANFSALGAAACNLTGCTMQGTLTTLGVVPAANNTYDSGSSSNKWANVYGTNVATATLTATGVTTLNTVAYTWPSAQTNGYFLQTNGSGTLSWAIAGFPTVTATKVATYTAAIGEFVVANGTFTVNLPAASGNSGKTIDVKNIGSGTITVDGNASETIDGATTFALTVQYQEVTVICDGSNWYVK